MVLQVFGKALALYNPPWYKHLLGIAKQPNTVNGQDERLEVLPKSWTKVMRQSHFEFCIGQDLTHSIFL